MKKKGAGPWPWPRNRDIPACVLPMICARVSLVCVLWPLVYAKTNTRDFFISCQTTTTCPLTTRHKPYSYSFFFLFNPHKKLPSPLRVSPSVDATTVCPHPNPIPNEETERRSPGPPLNTDRSPGDFACREWVQSLSHLLSSLACNSAIACMHISISRDDPDEPTIFVCEARLVASCCWDDRSVGFL